MMLWKEIETERLLLKNIDKDDNEFILDHFSDVEVTKYKTMGTLRYLK